MSDSTPLTPEWVPDAIFYQIFPDRFASSPRVNKPSGLEPWDTAPTTRGFKGGDLLGVVEKLDYLQDLGITALYFNPVFQSTANHRYHTYDYYCIDPILGGNAAFRELLDAAHARGMRIILDGVFNHASRGFYQFNHTLENGRHSPYLDWFTFHGFPVKAYDQTPNYEAWWNLPDLPKFNHANPQVREFLFQVAEHWIREGIDGWRLDVPAEIDDDEFWREFRRRVRALNPEAYIVGEIWHRADRWLQGDQFDAVMNYQFTRACLSFLVEPNPNLATLTQGHSYGPVKPVEAEAFRKMLEEPLNWYHPKIVYSQLNLLDSHDTARFLTIADGDLSALRLALLALFTYPGAPCLFYGDEIGLPGRSDPDCRRAMPWDPARWDQETLQTAKRLITMRKKRRALRRGRFASLYAKEKVFCYLRDTPDERLLVALNAGRAPVTLDLPVSVDRPGVTLTDEWSGETFPLAEGWARGLLLPPRAGRVWMTS